MPFSPETPLSGVGRVLEPTEYLHYEKRFDIPSDFNKGRVFIHFGAVDQIADVYLNGVHIGSHSGGYTPFSFEITDNIKEGENRLNVTVRDFQTQSSIPAVSKSLTEAEYGTALRAEYGRPFGLKAHPRSIFTQ